MMDTTTKRHRLVFESHNSWQDTAKFVANAEGHITVSVAEEKAVDSYNETFECSFTLDQKEAAKLRDWIAEVLTKAGY